LRGAHAGCNSGAIVISKYPIRPTTGWQCTFIFRHQLGNRGRCPRGLNELKVEWQVGAMKILAIISNKLLDRQVDFANQHTFIVLLKQRPHLKDHFVRLRLISVVAG